MSDNKEHTMQGGVDWELRTAEEAMVAAPGGSKELAQAMRRHADGVRNMMQSELVPSFQNAIDAITEKHTVRILSEVAISLDRITALVQQSVTLAREGIAIGKAAQVTGLEALAVGREALIIGRAAQETGVKALAVSESNAKRLGHVEKRFVEVEKTVMALKKGQTASDEQIRLFIADIADLRIEITALREAAKEAARIAKEHDRLNALAIEHERRLAEIEAWKAALEARG